MILTWQKHIGSCYFCQFLPFFPLARNKTSVQHAFNPTVSCSRHYYQVVKYGYSFYMTIWNSKCLWVKALFWSIQYFSNYFIIAFFFHGDWHYIWICLCFTPDVKRAVKVLTAIRLSTSFTLFVFVLWFFICVSSSQSVAQWSPRSQIFKYIEIML